MAVNRWCIAAGLAWLISAPAARGQGVAFQPVVGSIPNGPTLGVTPAVSVDRRYVRLGINPQFIAVEGFNTFLVPAAVGGGPGGPGALGGVGLGGGGRGGAVGGGQFLAGMDGIINMPMATSSPPYAIRPDLTPTGAATTAGPVPQATAAEPRSKGAATTRAKPPNALRQAKNDRARHPAAAGPPGRGGPTRTGP